MLAAWYERPGPAAEVLKVGEFVDPHPGAGEVRVRLTFSGINPGDTKKRADWVGNGMPYPEVIPHSDGAGVVDAVGDGVAASRIGERVWVYGAQSYRPFGTAAQLTTVPAEQAVALPAQVADELGACLGIPVSRRIVRYSPTARLPPQLCSFTVFLAPSARWRRSWQLGKVPR
jgi:NADPH2:quinone reductase